MLPELLLLGGIVTVSWLTLFRRAHKRGEDRFRSAVLDMAVSAVAEVVEGTADEIRTALEHAIAGAERDERLRELQTLEFSVRKLGSNNLVVAVSALLRTTDGKTKKITVDQAMDWNSIGEEARGDLIRTQGSQVAYRLFER